MMYFFIGLDKWPWHVHRLVSARGVEASGNTAPNYTSPPRKTSAARGATVICPGVLRPAIGTKRRPALRFYQRYLLTNRWLCERAYTCCSGCWDQTRTGFCGKTCSWLTACSITDCCDLCDIKAFSCTEDLKIWNVQLVLWFR